MAVHSELERLAAFPDAVRGEILAGIGAEARRRMAADWRMLARPAQLPPEGDWYCWLILAGRGFGKTRTGAEWVKARVLEAAGCRIALVGKTAQDVASVMVEGESGLLAVCPDDERPTYKRSRRELRWANGSVARLFSAAEPDMLRGPQFHYAWCDEMAAWGLAAAAWDNLRMALRLGERPRAVVTTTPRPIALLRALLDDAGVAVTRGSTYENSANLPAHFLDDMARAYRGTRIGRQELDGELLERLEGALWSIDGIDACRISDAPAMVRVVVGVDPPAGPGGCGIVAVGLDAAGIAHVLADASVSGASPEAWGRAVAACADRLGADRVVAEINNGGAMVVSVLRAAAIGLPVKTVRASRGKAARAEPVAALYAAGRVRHVGCFTALEDEMCGLIAGGGYVGPGTSPDRADALVWALTELMLERGMGRPGLRPIL